MTKWCSSRQTDEEFSCNSLIHDTPVPPNDDHRRINRDVHDCGMRVQITVRVKIWSQNMGFTAKDMLVPVSILNPCKMGVQGCVVHIEVNGAHSCWCSIGLLLVQHWFVQLQ